MNIISTIKQAGQSLQTLLIDYTEKDGSNEGWREVEPYSFRDKEGVMFFFGFDIQKGGIRQFNVENINDTKITTNTYTPRWPVEF